MSEVEICLCAVICHKYLAVLDRIHGSGINIDVGIKFLHGNCIAACLEQTAERSCGDSFSETGNDTTGDKYIFYGHNMFLLWFNSIYFSIIHLRKKEIQHA